VAIAVFILGQQYGEVKCITFSCPVSDIKLTRTTSSLRYLINLEGLITYISLLKILKKGSISASLSGIYRITTSPLYEHWDVWQNKFLFEKEGLISHLVTDSSSVAVSSCVLIYPKVSMYEVPMCYNFVNEEVPECLDFSF
jgi:hypothetical protein